MFAFSASDILWQIFYQLKLYPGHVINHWLSQNDHLVNLFSTKFSFNCASSILMEKYLAIQ